MTAQTVTTKNNSSLAQNNRSRILGKSSFWQVIWITVKMAAAIFLFIYRQKNGLLNELLGGAEIGWTRRCPTRCGRTYQWNEESALLYLWKCHYQREVWDSMCTGDVSVSVNTDFCYRMLRHCKITWKWSKQYRFSVICWIPELYVWFPLQHKSWLPVWQPTDSYFSNSLWKSCCSVWYWWRPWSRESDHELHNNSEPASDEYLRRTGGYFTDFGNVYFPDAWRLSSADTCIQTTKICCRRKFHSMCQTNPISEKWRYFGFMDK